MSHGNEKSNSPKYYQQRNHLKLLSPRKGTWYPFMTRDFNRMWPERVMYTYIVVWKSQGQRQGLDIESNIKLMLSPIEVVTLKDF